MLYNKYWDSQVKPVEPSLKGIIAWLETKDPNEKYCYTSPKNCAMAQYLKSIGQYKDRQPLYSNDINEILGTNFNIGKFPFHNTESKTFGELLANLKELDSQPS